MSQRRTQEKKDWKDYFQSFSFILLHNLKLVYTRDKCDNGFFKVNLTGTVDIAGGEDFAVVLSSLPVHSAGVAIFQTTYQYRH